MKSVFFYYIHVYPDATFMISRRFDSWGECTREIRERGHIKRTRIYPCEYIN